MVHPFSTVFPVPGIFSLPAVAHVSNHIFYDPQLYCENQWKL